MDENMQNVEKTYSQAEVDALLQQESDRRVSSALKKQEEKLHKEFETKQREAEKLRSMNENEKFVYELEQREKLIEQKERELALAENKNEASKILAEKGLSLSLVEFVVADSADVMKSNIDLLDKAFKQSVKEEVEKRLSSKTPKQNFVSEDTMTKEMFNKLPVHKQQDLLKNNPALLNLLK